VTEKAQKPSQGVRQAEPESPGVDLSAKSREERAELVGRLFKEHNRALVSFLRARLNNDQEAREVAQEAYVKLLQLETPGVVSFLQAYLFKIAANIAIDRVRHQIVGDRLTRDEQMLFDEVDETASPERKILAQEELQRISAAMQELPDKCRQAFALHVLLEWPLAEVAAEMKLSTRMVHYYIVRGLKVCKQVRSEYRKASDGIKHD
jgi:RNA polymerase sigma factor (sigma-70 family)